MHKKQKTTVNCVIDDDKCFQYAATVVLNHEEFGKIHKEYQKLNLLEINMTGKEYSKRFDINNPAIAFNVLYVKK